MDHWFEIVITITGFIGVGAWLLRPFLRWEISTQDKTPEEPPRRVWIADEKANDEFVRRWRIWWLGGDEAAQRYCMSDNEFVWSQKLYRLAQLLIATAQPGDNFIGWERFRHLPCYKPPLSKGQDGFPHYAWVAMRTFYEEIGLLRRYGNLYKIQIVGKPALARVHKYTRAHVGRQIRLPTCPPPNRVPGAFHGGPHDDLPDLTYKPRISPPVTPPLKYLSPPKCPECQRTGDDLE